MTAMILTNPKETDKVVLDVDHDPVKESGKCKVTTETIISLC